MLKPEYKQNKTNKKTITGVIVGAFLLFAILEIGLVVFDHFSKNSPDKSSYFFKDSMAVYGEADMNGVVKYGIIDKKGNVVIESGYDAVIPLGENRIGVAKEEKGKRKYAIKTTADEKITDFVYDEIRSYSGKVVAVKENGKWGYADTKGKYTIAPAFDRVHSFSEGVASVEKNGKWFFIDKNGKRISKESFEEAGNLKKGIARVKKDGKWGYIDVNFKWLVKPVYDEARDFEGGFAAVCKNGKWGFTDTSFKKIISPQYTFVRNFKNGIAAVADKDGNWGYITTDGSVVVGHNEEFSKAGDFSSSNRAAVYSKSDGKWSYINSEGKYIVKSRYSYAGDFFEGLAPVSEDGKKYTYINFEGKDILQKTYAHTSDFYGDGYSVIKTNDGKCFAINKKGIPFSDETYDALISGNDLKFFLTK